MALPTQTDLKTMDYVYLGQPYVYVTGQSTMDSFTMDYVYLGQPFVTNPNASTPAAGWTHKLNGVSNASISKINGIAKASIAKVNGV